MQPLRFRVWDPEYNTMIPPSDVWISFVFLEERTMPDAYLFDWRKKYWKPIPLCYVMQSLPRPAGRGKEIFEGDIIRIAGRSVAIVQALDTYSVIDRYAVSQPEILSHPGSRVMVVGNMGRSPGVGFERSVRELWRCQQPTRSVGALWLDSWSSRDSIAIAPG